MVVDGRRFRESFDFYCWRPAALFFRALVLFKVLTKYGKPYTKEHQIWWSSKRSQKLSSREVMSAVREAKKINSENGGYQMEKLRCYSFCACHRNFEVSKYGIPTLLLLSNYHSFRR